MEYIESKPTPVWATPEKVAKALQWFGSLATPPGVIIGSGVVVG